MRDTVKREFGSLTDFRVDSHALTDTEGNLKVSEDTKRLLASKINEYSSKYEGMMGDFDEQGKTTLNKRLEDFVREHPSIDKKNWKAAAYAYRMRQPIDFFRDRNRLTSRLDKLKSARYYHVFFIKIKKKFRFDKQKNRVNLRFLISANINKRSIKFTDVDFPKGGDVMNDDDFERLKKNLPEKLKEIWVQETWDLKREYEDLDKLLLSMIYRDDVDFPYELTEIGLSPTESIAKENAENVSNLAVSLASHDK